MTTVVLGIVITNTVEGTSVPGTTTGLFGNTDGEGIGNVKITVDGTGDGIATTTVLGTEDGTS
jgi:hypothetical protein